MSYIDDEELKLGVSSDEDDDDTDVDLNEEDEFGDPIEDALIDGDDLLNDEFKGLSDDTE